MKNQKTSLRVLKQKGRLMPIEQCYVADLYDKKGLTMCMIVRKQPNGHYAFANLLIDRLCVGLKKCLLNTDFSRDELDGIISKMEKHAPVKEVSPEYLHNIVYAALDYAEELGIRAPKIFEKVEFLLNPNLVDDGIDAIEMGWKGEPYYIQGGSDNVAEILEALNASVGKGNYKVVLKP